VRLGWAGSECVITTGRRQFVTPNGGCRASRRESRRGPQLGVGNPGALTGGALTRGRQRSPRPSAAAFCDPESRHPPTRDRKRSSRPPGDDSSRPQRRMPRVSPEPRRDHQLGVANGRYSHRAATVRAPESRHPPTRGRERSVQAQRGDDSRLESQRPPARGHRQSLQPTRGNDSRPRTAAPPNCGGRQFGVVNGGYCCRGVIVRAPESRHPPIRGRKRWPPPLGGSS